MKHSPWMMGACVGLVAAGLVVGLAFADAGALFLLLVIPCIVMLGAMLWMMGRGPKS